MSPIKYFIHGSEDSLDVDAFFVVDRLSDVKHDNKVLCDKLSTDFAMNGNLITIDNGVVTSVFKGTVDEVNNSLLATYHLHHQYFPCPIEVILERDVNMKFIRVLRGILSHASRTQHRSDVKRALHSESALEKLEVFQSIKFGEIENFEKNPVIEVRKFIAFQLAQLRGLLDGIEIYTKGTAALRYEIIKPFLYREVDTVPAYLDSFKDMIQFELLEMAKKLDAKIPTKFGVLDVKTEQYTRTI